MKYIFLNLLFCLSFIYAQTTVSDIESIKVNKNITTHFYCFQNIDYSDLSSDMMVGHLPKPNVLAIKPVSDSLTYDMGVLTILGEDFMKQYNLVYTNNSSLAHTKVFINTGVATEITNPTYNITTSDIKQYAKDISKRKNSTYHGNSAKGYGLEIRLRNIYTYENLYFIDYEVFNDTNIQYDFDQVRYKIRDKKVTKATNSQDVEIYPKYSLYNKPFFRKHFRNVIVLEKFTFPDDKIFAIEIAEKQISGRTVTLRISYKDILKAELL